MVNVWAGVAAMSGVTTECANRGLGCVVIVCDSHEQVGHENWYRNGGK